MIVSLCRGASASRHMRTITNRPTAGAAESRHQDRQRRRTTRIIVIMSSANKNDTPPENNTTPIAKPSNTLDKFKSKRAATSYGVDNLVDGMPHQKIGETRDFFRLHPDEEEFWSDELCFVMVPVKGSKRDSLHLIAEDLAVEYLPSGKVLRFRLALGSKPYDVFFLAHVPSQNLDNTWNSTALQACEQAKTLWTQAISRKDEGVDSYKVDKARNREAFPEPKWPRGLTLDDLIAKAFAGRMIDTPDHPALLRLIGEKQSLR